MAFALDLPLVIPVVGLIYVVEMLSDIIQVDLFQRPTAKRFFRMAPPSPPGDGGWSETSCSASFPGITLLLCVLAFWAS